MAGLKVEDEDRFGSGAEQDRTKGGCRRDVGGIDDGAGHRSIITDEERRRTMDDGTKDEAR
jgi:hypothetical protein